MQGLYLLSSGCNRAGRAAVGCPGISDGGRACSLRTLRVMSAPRGPAMLAHAVRGLAVVLALTITAALWDGSRFGWHPTLMTIGFVGAMSEGVLAALQLRSIDPGPERLRGLQRHACIQAAALACAAGGFYAIYSNKVRRAARPGRRSWPCAAPGCAAWCSRSARAQPDRVAGAAGQAAFPDGARARGPGRAAAGPGRAGGGRARVQVAGPARARTGVRAAARQVGAPQGARPAPRGPPRAPRAAGARCDWGLTPLGPDAARRRGLTRLCRGAQLGLVTWLCALAAVELALTHPAVYKARPPGRPPAAAPGALPVGTGAAPAPVESRPAAVPLPGPALFRAPPHAAGAERAGSPQGSASRAWQLGTLLLAGGALGAACLPAGRGGRGAGAGAAV